jgi:hypothetical protein
VIAMPPDDELPVPEFPIPRDIPWKLANTTLLRSDDQDPPGSQSTISLFYHEPSVESLATDYPNEQVIYLRATVSICPAKLPSDPTDSSTEDVPLDYRDYLDGLSGVWHALFDVSVRPPESHGPDVVGRPGGYDPMRPYFHAVAPVSRELVQTGVVGNDHAQGSSDTVGVGKSATQLDEQIFTVAHSSSGGKSLDLGVFGASSSSTTTGVYTDRTLNEVVDTTSREASQERRELLSHHTDIKNVLSLLTTAHVGTPYIRFSLWPQPISLLGLDPGDPNLWYAELLRRRSSGLEGIQEFFLVLVVPKGHSFCIRASLKRFFVQDVPPERPRIDSGFAGGVLKAFEEEVSTGYLFRKYPRGTPLDLLDVDLGLDHKVYPRPSVAEWFPQVVTFTTDSNRFDNVMVLIFNSPPSTVAKKWTLKKGINVKVTEGAVCYKNLRDVYLEAVRAQYEYELSQSPLERGVVRMRETILDTCFGNQIQGSSGLSVDTTERDTNENDIDATVVSDDGKGSANAGFAEYLQFRNESPARRLRAIVNRWNQAQHDFSRRVALVEDWSAPQPERTDTQAFELLLAGAERLDDADARNVPIARLSQQLGLSEHVQARLMAGGLTNLRSLARYLRSASTLEPDPRRQPLLDRGTRQQVTAALMRASRQASQTRRLGRSE